MPLGYRPPPFVGSLPYIVRRGEGTPPYKVTRGAVRLWCQSLRPCGAPPFTQGRLWCAAPQKASQSSQPAGCELFESFSPAACTWGKILLSSPVCPSGARSELQISFGRKNEVFSPVILIIFAAACTWQKYPDLAALGGDTSDRGQLVRGDVKGRVISPLIIVYPFTAPAATPLMMCFWQQR